MIIKKQFHNKIIGLVALFLFSVCSSAQDIQYGLKFKSYEVEKEKRTSLNLTPEKPLSLPSGYTFSFDLKFHSSGRDPFGYVFRMYNEENQHISMLLNILKDTTINKLVFTYASEEILNMTFDDLGMSFDKWYKIEVNVDTRQTLFTVQIGNKSFTKNLPALKTFDKINVIFGRNDHYGLQITDIPSMTVKDIRIYGERKQKILYEWLLKNYTDVGSYDEIKHKLAVVDNPDWLLNQHVFWRKKCAFVADPYPQIAYNKKNSEIGIYNKIIFYYYNIPEDRRRVDTVRSYNPWGAQSGNMLFDRNSGRYVYYTFKYEEGADVLSYDPEKKEWDKTPDRHYAPDFWHHNRLISDYDGKLYLFGGYGHHKYKNDIRIYDFEENEWKKEQLKGDNFYPHYLGGLGVLDDKHVLIFGGYGSETGEQALAPRFFYDLYKVNIETMESEKLWTLEKPESDFVVSNSLVVDTVTRSFYALVYPLHQFHANLTLLKFSMDRPYYEVLGDSIPVNFEDTKSNVDLFLDKKSENLVAVTSGPIVLHGTENEISIYTLSYPPLAEADLYQEIPSAVNFNRLLFILLMIAVLLVVVFLYYRKTRQHQVGVQPGDIQAESENKTVFAWKKEDEPVHVQSVFLFGGFCVIDEKGNDVTKDFTPMLKQLFLLILLYTYKERKGISSTKLKDILWYDKSDESAKNNRGVSIRKLRQIFEQVGDISIKSNNSYWTVEFGENIYCDYSEALYLISKFSKDESFNIEDLKRLLSVLSRGELLPNLQVEWVDSFKADLSNELMDILLDLSKKEQVLKDVQLSIDLADAIFIHDSLNEDALRLKCTMLVKIGRNKLSKNVYESFVKEYQQLFGANFEFSFEQIINNQY